MLKRFNFNISVIEYCAREKDNLFPEIANIPHGTCPHRGRWWKNGFYERNVVCFYGVFRIVIQRYRCPVCGMTLSLIPSFVAPHFQYSLAVIFTCLQALAVIGRTLVKAAASVNIEGFSYQHVRFYKKRLQTNLSLCVPVLASLAYSGPINEQFLTVWVQEVAKIDGIENFALQFDKTWHCSFLAKLSPHQLRVMPT